MAEREPLSKTHVVFPHDLDTWSRVSQALSHLSQPSQDLDSALDKLCRLWAAKRNSKHTVLPIDKTPFPGLKAFFQRYGKPEETEQFVMTTLPCIAKLTLEGETLVKEIGGIKLSLQRKPGVTVFSRKIAASIVATGFLCLFPGCVDENDERMDTMPDINFAGFFRFMSQSQRAKLKCFLHYFERLAASDPELTGNITFRRISLTKEMLSKDILNDSQKPLCPFVVKSEGTIEDSGSRVLQVDFANEYLGGGVLFTGCVQEEIRFSICPELVSSMLFMECMMPNEAVIISGFEQYSQYTGYGHSLKYGGDFVDNSERDSTGNILTSLCAIDAVPYIANSGNQFEELHYMRDINKAYAGFLQPYIQDRSPIEVQGQLNADDDSWVFKQDPDKIRAVATGNWGCGAFGGNAQFKSLLQWLAASVAGCPAVIYYTFDNPDVANLARVTSLLWQKGWTVGDLYKMVQDISVEVLGELEEMGRRHTEPFDYLLGTFGEGNNDQESMEG